MHVVLYFGKLGTHVEVACYQKNEWCKCQDFFTFLLEILGRTQNAQLQQLAETATFVGLEREWIAWTWPFHCNWLRPMTRMYLSLHRALLHFRCELYLACFNCVLYITGFPRCSWVWKTRQLGMYTVNSTHSNSETRACLFCLSWVLECHVNKMHAFYRACFASPFGSRYHSVW